MTRPVDGPRAVDYEVGYGRPPAEHRFRKGKSGNPAGRPRRDRVGALSLLEALEATANRKLTLVLNGKRERVTALEAMLLRTQQLALDGRQDAVRTLLACYMKVDRRRSPAKLTTEAMDLRCMDPAAATRAYIEFIRGEPDK